MSTRRERERRTAIMYIESHRREGKIPRRDLFLEDLDLSPSLFSSRASTCMFLSLSPDTFFPR